MRSLSPEEIEAVAEYLTRVYGDEAKALRRLITEIGEYFGVVSSGFLRLPPDGNKIP